MLTLTQNNKSTRLIQGLLPELLKSKEVRKAHNNKKPEEFESWLTYFLDCKLTVQLVESLLTREITTFEFSNWFNQSLNEPKDTLRVFCEVIATNNRNQKSPFTPNYTGTQTWPN